MGRRTSDNSRNQKMDDSKERRKCMKSRRRSLRTLQPVDAGVLVGDQVESLDTTLVDQPMYGSIWIEQAVSPALVRKPRRSISCSQISHDLANSVIRNNKNIYGKELIEKENCTPVSSPLKMVEDTPKRTPVLYPAISSNSSLGNCSMEDVWNQENSYEEIGVPRYGHRTLDGSVSEDSLVGTISILSIDDTDLQCQDEKFDRSVGDELQISLDSFSKKEQNRIGVEDMSPSADQITDPVTSFVEGSAESPQDRLFDSMHSPSRSPDDIICANTTPNTSVEAWSFNDCLPVFSGEEISIVPSKYSPPFSTEFVQDFQQLDISESDVTTEESDSATTAVDEDSDAESLDESTPLFTPDKTFNTSHLNDSSLDQFGSQHSDSWCFIKCYSDEEASDVSTLMDSSVSDGCEVWETDLSSAGSELSDSWYFSRHLNTSGHFNSTPSKTASLISHDQCVESVQHLSFETEPETIPPVGIDSSVGITTEPSTVPLEKEEQILPGIEYLNLGDSSSDSNEEHQIQIQENSQIKGTELCVTSNDKSTVDKLAKTLHKKTLSKKSTQQISDPKTKKTKPSLKTTLPSTKRKPSDNSAKTLSNQAPTPTTACNRNSPDLTRKVTSIRTKKPVTMNTKVAPNDKLKSDPNKLKSSDLKKTLGGKREPALNTQRPSELSLKLVENSIKSLSKPKGSPKAASPDVIVMDALETATQMNTNAPLGGKGKTLSHVRKSTKPITTEKRKALKGSNKSLPVETPLHESKLNQSLPQPGQQMNSGPVPVSFEDLKAKADPIETLPEPSVKKRQSKGINAPTVNQVPRVSTSTGRTKRKSLDSLATSTVTIRRPNACPRSKSMDTSCDSESLINLEKAKKPASNKWEKHRRRALVVPALETSDITVVDLESLASKSSDNDCTFSDDIFEKQVTSRTKRRCQLNRSTNSSIENSFVNEDPTALTPMDSTVSHSTSDRDDKPTTETKCGSVGSGSSFTEGPLEMVVEPESQDTNVMMPAGNPVKSKVSRGRRKSLRSMGSVPEREPQNMEVGETPSDESPLSEPVKILDETVLAAISQSQAPLRRSTRRRSIELSLSSNVTLKLASGTAQGYNNTPTLAQSVDKKVNNNNGGDDDDYERLREIYAKKPYVPISPSRLETIYSPYKKRGDTSVFSKRKVIRMISFQPSETRLKNRRKKAMRNWPFLFEVPDIDEKLNKLLNIA